MTTPSALRIAVYPGTFDPITLGHEDVLRRAALCFDRLIVGVAVAHHKTPWFSLQERMNMVMQALKGCDNIWVEPFDGLLVDFCEQHQAQVVLRGVRNWGDFEFESQLALMNRKMRPQHETLMMVPQPQWSAVSSTIVREIARLGGPLNDMVSSEVAASLRERVARDASR